MVDDIIYDRLDADRQEISVYYDTLFKHATGGYISLRSFTQDKDSWPIGGHHRTVDGERLYVWPTVEATDREAVIALCVESASWCASQEKAIVFCPPVCTLNHGFKARAQDIRQGLGLSVECDNNPAQSAATTRALLGTPTLVMASGGVSDGEPKLHIHYRLKRPTTTPEGHEKLRQARNMLAKIVSSDKTASNSCHPMRMAGSWNCKPGKDPVMARIIEVNDAVEIDLDWAYDIIAMKAEESGLNKPQKTIGERYDFQGTPSKDDSADQIRAKAAVAAEVAANGPVLDYFDWLNVGIELHSAYDGGGEGLRLWEDFTRAQGYDDRECAFKYSGFTDGGRTYASLFQRALDIDPTCFDRFNKTADERLTEKLSKMDGVMGMKDMLDDWKQEYGDKGPDAEELDDGITPKKSDPPQKPQICVNVERLMEQTDEVERHMITANLGLYQYNGNIVYVGRFPDGKGGEYVRITVLKSKDAIAEYMTRAVTFMKMMMPLGRPKEGAVAQWKPCKCPPEISGAYLARKGRWRLPNLRAVITCPLMRLDSSLLTREGYDPATQLYLVCDAKVLGAVHDIAVEPTLDDAKAAVNDLLGMMPEVSFRKHHAGLLYEAVVIAGMLGLMQKWVNGNTPVLVINGNKAGAGKSRLAVAIGQTVMGTDPVPQSQMSEDDTEFDKALLSAIRGGSPVIFLDDRVGIIISPLLCQITTNGLIDIRVMQKNENERHNDVGFVMVTCNNGGVGGDLIRRTTETWIAPDAEDPRKTRFASKPPEVMARLHRPVYVKALLTILRGWVAAGRPTLADTPVGSFDNWEMVRNALIWAGLPDIELTMQAIEENDADKQKTLALCQHWYEFLEMTGNQRGDRPATVAHLYERAMEQHEWSPGMNKKPLKNPRLKAAIQAVIDMEGEDNINSVKFGKWLEKKDDTRWGEYKIQRVRDPKTGKLIYSREGGAMWRVYKPADDPAIYEPGGQRPRPDDIFV